MAWAIAAQIIATADGQLDRRRFSQLLVDGGKIHFAYEKRTAAATTNTSSKIYYRNWNGSALSTPVLASASPNIGYNSPGIGIWDDGRIFIVYENGEYKTTQIAGRFVESADGGATWTTPWIFNGTSRFVWTGVPTNASADALIISRGATAGTFGIWRDRRLTATTFSSGLVISYGGVEEGGENKIFGMYNIPHQATAIREGRICMVGSKDNGDGPKHVVSLAGPLTAAADERIVYSSTVPANRTPIMIDCNDGVLRMVFTNLKADGLTPTIDLAMSYDFGLTWTLLARPAVFDTTDSFGTVVKWPPIDKRGEIGFCVDRSNQWWVTVPHYDSTGTIKDRLHLFKGSPDGLTWTLHSSEAITDGGTIALDASPNSTVATGPHSSVAWDTDLYRIVSAKDSVSGYVEMWLMKNASAAAGGRGPTGGSSTAYRFQD